MSGKFQYKFGWLPDYPDMRDYTEGHEKILPLLSRLRINGEEALPSNVDLRKWCSPVENQGDIGSCTAHAVAGVVEYFENKSFGKHLDASRLFLYKVTRNLLHFKGDTGAFLKSALGALVLFGMPPEEYWPYETERFDDEPDAFCYAFAQNYQCISYFRHDPSNVSPEEVLKSVKKYLAAGIPSVFGFTVYQSVRHADADGCIPFPSRGEKILGGHAVAAVGYDDGKEISNPADGKTVHGALLIRNSWGVEWGEQGYGWLPYEYVLQGLALDWWSVLKQEWVDAGIFTKEENS
ncbi:MAG: C1 family peptidase [Clostridiales bacterium]|jgi:C1A family cysteine protease|nr:cysteine protease [Eubacteriales bacterium]MDH7567786.1 C1 family peptidase [Clostridiales bacterium]